MFAPEIYQQRRSRLVTKKFKGVLLFPGNEAVPRNYPGNTYPFRQDSTFLYFWGLDIPDLVACLDGDTGEAILFGNDSTPEEQVWTGPQVPLIDQAQAAGISNVKTLDALPDYITSVVNQGRSVLTLPQYRAENVAFLQWLRNETGFTANREEDDRFLDTVIALRSQKAPEEVAEIQAAIAITTEFHQEVMRKARPGMSEQELAGFIEGHALSRGSRMAYPVILTTHGEILHNVVYDNILQDGDLILNDSGANSKTAYASDITRTFPVSGRFTPQQKEIVELVLKMQREALKRLKPGVPYRDIHLEACRVAAEGLTELGLMTGDPDEIVASGAHALFFPHGLGHMLGLDVHDMENLGEDRVGYTPELQRSSQFGLSALRLARPLETGFVLTVEPGLYFIPQLIRQWEGEGLFTSFIRYDRLTPYLNFGGVRIEDNVLITEQGAMNLSAKIPKTVAEVEAICSSG